MPKPHVLRSIVAFCALCALTSLAAAQDTVKIGLILPMTGPFASTGRQIEAAVKLYMAENGTTVAGKKIELIVKDDTNVADVTKRLAQEMVVNDGVKIIAGFGLTPLALAAAPISAQAKVPQIVMAAGTSIITERSPYIVRTSRSHCRRTPRRSAKWAAKNGIKKVIIDRHRLRAGPRRREVVQGQLHQGRRRDRRRSPRADRQPGFRALPAARRRRQAGRNLRVRAVGPGCDLHQAVRRARPRQIRHQTDRDRRPDG